MDGEAGWGVGGVAIDNDGINKYLILSEHEVFKILVVKTERI